MNREIEFRGKSEKNNEWVYGHLISQYDADACSPCTYYIIETMDFSQDVDNYKSLYDVVNYGDYYEVYENTIGQYIGLKDKNGTKIFEGDIFEDEKNEIRGIVIFENGSFRIKWFGLKTTLYEYGYDDGDFGEVECETFDMYNIDQMEVIGNIYDNPKILQQTE